MPAMACGVGMLSGGAMTLGSLLEHQKDLRLYKIDVGMTLTLVIENDSERITRRFVGGLRAETLPFPTRR